MTAVELVDTVPPLPARGEQINFDVASRSNAGTYSMWVTVHLDGAIWFSCSCPSRRTCWHKTTLAEILLIRGEAERHLGSLRDTRPALVSVPDDDPFRGLV